MLRIASSYCWRIARGITMFDWSSRQYNKTTVRLTREGNYHSAKSVAPSLAIELAPSPVENAADIGRDWPIKSVP